MQKLAGNEMLKVGYNPDEYQFITRIDDEHDVFTYQQGVFHGILHNGKVVTPPHYTPNVRYVSNRYVTADEYKEIPYYNRTCLIDLLTGKEVVKRFSAWVNYKGKCFAFRVNGFEEMRWGIYSLVENKIIAKPTLTREQVYDLMATYVTKLG